MGEEAGVSQASDPGPGFLEKFQTENSIKTCTVPNGRMIDER
jgi:hypothetical protein